MRKRILREILAELREIAELLEPRKAVKTVFLIGGVTNVANFQLGANQKAPYVITEVDVNGNPVAPKPGDMVSISSSTADVSIVPDATPVVPGALATGFIVGNPTSTGALGVAIIETTTLANGAVLPAVVNLVDVVTAAGGAVATTFVFGTPVAQ